MTEYEKTSITVPVGLLERARKVGLNVSGTASIAIENNVKKLEEQNES